MPKSVNALKLLRDDHRHLLGLLRRFDETDDERERRDVCGEIIAELDAHTELEERYFYPFVREASDRADLIEEATIEHGTAKDLVEKLRKPNHDDVHFHALGKVLRDYVELHVREEEEKIFPVVEKLGVDLNALGEELAEHKRNGEASKKRGHAQPRTQKAGARKHAESKGEAAESDEQFVREHAEGLSKSAQRAKWIDSTDEHADHPGQTLATRNTDVIQQWAEERKAKPATTPGGDAERPRVLRFDFPDYDESLQGVSWDAWLDVFRERDLVFLFQEQTSDGKQSNFFRLDNPEREEG